MLADAVASTAKTVAANLPVGLSERGVGRCVKVELELLGLIVDPEQPVVVRYAASNGVSVAVQTNYIDFVVRDPANAATVGIELKHAKAVTAAHLKQATGYANVLGVPVAAVAIGEGEYDVRFVNHVPSATP